MLIFFLDADVKTSHTKPEGREKIETRHTMTANRGTPGTGCYVDNTTAAVFSQLLAVRGLAGVWRGNPTLLTACALRGGSTQDEQAELPLASNKPQVVQL